MMYSFGILVAICVGIVAVIRWMGRRSAEVTEYFADSDDPTVETLLRTNEMNGN